jgi:F0F1-type ATP synthase membrane subunit c/vacuolar-type H+-ATPase subunit K
MNNWYVLMVLLAVMIAVIGVYAFSTAKKLREIRKKHPGYPVGYFQARGMGIGIALGCGIGVAMNNIGAGVGIGVAIGAAIGVASEKQHKDEIRPPTEEERALKKQKIKFALATFTVGFLVFAIVYLMNK